MHLTDLQQFFQRHKKKLIIVFAVFVIIAIASAFWGPELAGLGIPESKKLPPFTLSTPGGSIVRGLDLTSLSSVELPQKAAAYTSSEITSSFFTEAEAAKLAERFGVKGELRKATLPDSDKQVLTFVGKKASLMVTTQPRALSYVSGVDMSTEGTLYDQATAVAQAKKFMSDKGLPTDQISSSAIKYLVLNDEASYEVDDPTQAQAVWVSFTWSVEGRELYGEAPTDAAAELIFDRQGNVITLKFNFLDRLFTRFGDVELLPFSQATSKLAKEGLVVFTLSTGAASGWSLEAENLYTFVPTSVKLIYARPSGSTYIYPVYLFEGKGTTGAGQEVKAAVYLLAVSPKYLKSQ